MAILVTSEGNLTSSDIQQGDLHLTPDGAWMGKVIVKISMNGTDRTTSFTFQADPQSTLAEVFTSAAAQTAFAASMGQG